MSLFSSSSWIARVAKCFNFSSLSTGHLRNMLAVHLLTLRTFRTHKLTAQHNPTIQHQTYRCQQHHYVLCGGVKKFTQPQTFGLSTFATCPSLSCFLKKNNENPALLPSLTLGLDWSFYIVFEVALVKYTPQTKHNQTTWRESQLRTGFVESAGSSLSGILQLQDPWFVQLSLVSLDQQVD